MGRTHTAPYIILSFMQAQTNWKTIFFPILIFEQHALFETNQQAIKQRAGQYFIAFLVIKEGGHLTDGILYFSFIF